jgi:hypothetical protein
MKTYVQRKRPIIEPHRQWVTVLAIACLCVLLPVKLYAQAAFEVKTSQGDDIIAVHVNSGSYSLFDLYDKKNLSLRIATYDMASGKATNVDLDNADEVKHYAEGAKSYTNVTSMYRGPVPGAAQTPAVVPAAPPTTVMAAVNPLQVPITFSIVSADAKNAVLKIAYGGKEATLKIEANPSGFQGFKDSLGNMYRSSDGNFATWRGAKAVRLAVIDRNGDQHIPKYFNPDGTPMVDEIRSNGNSTGRMISYWPKQVFVDMADQLEAFVKAKGGIPIYTPTLSAIGGKPVAPSTQ